MNKKKLPIGIQTFAKIRQSNCYLKQVQQGEEITVTLHGKSIAKIIPNHPENKRELALQRLEKLRGTMLVGDVVSPLVDEWTGDADNL